MSVKLSGKKIEVETKIRVCDFCGIEMDEQKVDHSLSMFFDFGYGSNRDGEHWNLDGCNNCAEKIIPLLETLRKTAQNDEFHGAD